MRAVVLVAALVLPALASQASATETRWSKVVTQWLDRWDPAIGRYTRADFTSAQVKDGASCKAEGDAMVACRKKGSLSYNSASFGADKRAYYFSLTLTTEEAREPCMEIAQHLKASYGTPSYGIEGGGVGYNLPKKKRHIEFGPTRGTPGCILSIQAGLRSK